MVLVQGPAARNSRLFCLEDDEQDLQVDSEAQEKEEEEVKEALASWGDINWNTSGSWDISFCC